MKFNFGNWIELMDWMINQLNVNNWYEIMNVSINSLKSYVIGKLNNWMEINLIKPIESDGDKPNWMNISKGIWL